jgi:hypothetical protein
VLTREQIARVLYAAWAYEDGFGDAPTAEAWADFDLGSDLNDVGLTKANFLETADAIIASVNLAE